MDSLYGLNQWSPTPGPQTSTGPWVNWYITWIISIFIYYLQSQILKNDRILSVASVYDSNLIHDVKKKNYTVWFSLTYSNVDDNNRRDGTLWKSEQLTHFLSVCVHQQNTV